MPLDVPEHATAGCASAAAGPRVPVGEFVRRLRDSGLRPLLLPGPHGNGTNSIGVNVSVAELAECRVARRWHMHRIRALLLQGCAVTLTFRDNDASDPRALETVLRYLHVASSAPCVDRRRLALAIEGEGLPLPAYLLMSRIWLGAGPRYVILPGDTAGIPCSPAPDRALYSSLFQHRQRGRAMSPVFEAGLRSRCPLLPDEAARGFVTPLALAGSPGSAWLPIRFDVCRYADRRGRLRETELLGALRSGLAQADRLFDELHWADAQQRHDARQNRRIVFLPDGLGDLVVLRRADPSGIACLRALDRLLAKMHDCLWNESQRLARTRGVLPALAARDPSRQLPCGSTRRRWRERWRSALAQSAVRHRNLLALSPYGLLPRGAPGNAAFTDLLPLLAYADTLCFAGPVSFPGWRVDEFSAFLRRARAVMHRRNSATFVAG